MAELPTTSKFALSWKQLFTERDKHPFNLQYLKSKRSLYNNSYTRILMYLRYEISYKIFSVQAGFMRWKCVDTNTEELLYLQCTQTKTKTHYH